MTLQDFISTTLLPVGGMITILMELLKNGLFMRLASRTNADGKPAWTEETYTAVVKLTALVLGWIAAILLTANETFALLPAMGYADNKALDILFGGILLAMANEGGHLLLDAATNGKNLIGAAMDWLITRTPTT